MNQLQLASVLLKVLGLYSIIRALVLSENFYQAIFATRLPSTAAPAENHALLIFASLVPISLLVGAGILLIRQSGRLAPLIAGPASEGGAGSYITPHVFQSIAFSVLGLYLSVSAIPGLFCLFWNLLGLNEAVPAAMRINVATETWAFGVRLSLQFILGLWVFFGARGFSNLWFSSLKLQARDEE
jgi:hypothetical protein